VNCPLEFELLVRYWTHDLPETEAEAIEEHLFTCAQCASATARVAAIGEGVREVVPPVALERDIARARALGVILVVNDLSPDEEAIVTLPRGADFLVHRLRGDFRGTRTLDLEVRTPDGAVLASFPDAPFDADAGAALVACSRHFMELFPPEAQIVLHQTDSSGAERSATFTIVHELE
jgi:hypothetical protein